MQPSPELSESPAGTNSFLLRVRPWLLMGALFVLLVGILPVLQTRGLRVPPAEQLGLENQLRDTWAKIFWVGATLWGASILSRHALRLGQVVDLATQTLGHAQKNAYFAAQAASTERYARAMALLGDPKTEVSLGGIYSLERLARESDKDHGPIMEVLSAYVRERARWQEGEISVPRTAPDIQAILTVLGRRHVAYDAPEQRLDLHGVNLARVYLPWANLDKAFLYESNLEGAMLQHANLRGSWLWKANLKDATLDGAHLEGADLTGVAGLTREQLVTAIIDKSTKLPDHLRDIREGARETPQEEPVDAADLALPSLVQ